MAVSSRAAICGLVGSRATTTSSSKRKASAVGAVELSLVGREPADQRAHAVRIGEREAVVVHERPHPLERLALGDLRLQREPFVEDKRLRRIASAKRLERMFALIVRLEGDRRQRAEAFGHVVGVGKLAMGELQSLDHVAVDKETKRHIA